MGPETLTAQMETTHLLARLLHLVGKVVRRALCPQEALAEMDIPVVAAVVVETILVGLQLGLEEMVVLELMVLLVTLEILELAVWQVRELIPNFQI